MKPYTVVLYEGAPTLGASAIVTEQQGSWKWQVKLRTAFYAAVYSKRVKAWIWKSYEQSAPFSGGNTRKPLIRPDGTKHNRRLNGIELAALAVVRGENFQIGEVQ